MAVVGVAVHPGADPWRPAPPVTVRRTPVVGVRSVLASADRDLLDHVRTALRDTVAIAAEVTDAVALLAAVRDPRPGTEAPRLAVVDLDLPGGALRATAALVGAGPVDVVLLSRTEVAEPLVLRAVRAGAMGLLTTSIPAESLAAAVRGVANGEAALPRRHVAALVEQFRSRPGSRLVVDGHVVRLTQRELEVLHLVRSGHSTPSIASRLGVGSTTVRTHVAALARKLQVAGRAGLLESTAGRSRRLGSGPGQAAVGPGVRPPARRTPLPVTSPAAAAQHPRSADRGDLVRGEVDGASG